MTANPANLLEKPSPPRGHGQRVLVVADDPGDSELLSTTLELAGYRVGTAGTGAEGLVRLTEHAFDLAVWDAVLLSHLTHPPHTPRAGSRPPHPPLLFLATCDSLHRLVPELGPGEKDYVTKPLRIAEVLARVDVLLRRRLPERRTVLPRYGDLVWTTPPAGPAAAPAPSTSRPPSTACCAICSSTPGACCRRSRSAVMSGGTSGPTRRSRSSSPGSAARWTAIPANRP